MILHHNIIAKIEGLIEKGHTVELRLEEVPPAPNKPPSLRVSVNKRPDTEADIFSFAPILIDLLSPTPLTISAGKGGEAPVELVKAVAPAGWYLAGLKGYQAISQEITPEEE